MENSVRTAGHLARIRQRDTDLRAACAALLPPPASFVWEAGCGHGHFLTAYAAAHPDRTCIGIDLTADRIARAERKRVRSGLPNLHFLQAEAGAFLSALPDQARLSEIYVLFPDPWPKRRHHKNRLMQPDFLEAIARRAGEGARLHFRTDNEDYFAYVEAVIDSDRTWEKVPGPWQFEVSTVFQARASSHRSLIAVRR